MAGQGLDAAEILKLASGHGDTEIPRHIDANKLEGCV
jgi:hypothetical protein